MSAIAGIYQLDGRPVESAAIQRMLECVRHRGPDGLHVWTDGAVGFGHGMLRTTPESTAEAQPLANEDERFILTADARVDNREELQATFEARGIRLRSDTDAELILRAYELWGDECPAKIVGDFSFAIWDTPSQRLFCARDPLGVKPFYYYADHRRLMWASEPRQILMDPTIGAEPNLRSLGLYLHQRTLDRDQTLYEGIHRLLPAHSLIVSGKCVTTSRYWDLDPDYTVTHKTDADYAAHFQALFEEAVRCRLRSRGNVGALLSGGLDSSSVVCMAEKIRRDGRADGVPMDTYSVVFETLPCDERNYVDAVTTRWGTRAHFAVFEHEEAELRIDRALDYFDLLYDPTVFMCIPLLRRARDASTRVCLAGLGADELLASSFDHLTDLLMRRRFGALTEQLRYDSTQYGQPVRSLTWNYCVKPLIPAPLKALLRPMVKRLRGDNTPGWIVPEFVDRSGLRDGARNRVRVRKFPTRSQQHIYNLLVVGLNANLDLTQTDRLASYHSMEFRYPFLDRRVIEFLVGIPEDQRWWMDRPKAILRRALDGILPDAIRDRKDKSCYTVANDWELRERQAVTVQSVLQNSTLEKMGVIDGDRVRAMFAEYRDGASKYDLFKIEKGSWAVWTVVRLELWLKTLAELRERRCVVDEHEKRPSTETDPPKRPYSKPQLTRYGDVTQLTLAGGSTTTDVLTQKKISI